MEGHQRTGGTLCSFIGKHAHQIKAYSNHRPIRIPPPPGFAVATPGTTSGTSLYLSWVERAPGAGGSALSVMIALYQDTGDKQGLDFYTSPPPRQPGLRTHTHTQGGGKD